MTSHLQQAIQKITKLQDEVHKKKHYNMRDWNYSLPRADSDDEIKVFELSDEEEEEH